MLCSNLSVNNGLLYFAGQNTVYLAKEYGTPLYLMDEDRIRENCRTYVSAFKKYFSPDAKPVYASKANSFKYIYKIIAEEGFGIDVVSTGEIYTALQVGYDLSQAYFHSNNKTDADITFAMDNSIGYFVADNFEEVVGIEHEASKRGITQKILLRLTPGIDPHTYEAISTGKVDSKFGFAIETGQAEEVTEFTLKQPHIQLCGFHCHVGSQVFYENVFEDTSVIMLEFIASMKSKFDFTTAELNLGGGFGVRYVETDPFPDIDKKIRDISCVIKETCQRLTIKCPAIRMEPGRSIVADAGMTLYTCGSVKRIPGYKNYVSIDGGMQDNPRYPLYHAAYTCLSAGRMDEEKNMKCSVVGCCCESGDIIQEDVMMPESTCRGDIIAVCTTGAYNYSMASNYNRHTRPPVIMLKNGCEHFPVVRRETFEDLCRNDL